MIFSDKRPYTSSAVHGSGPNQMSKRSAANQKQSSAIAALYLGHSNKQVFGKPEAYNSQQH